MSQRFQLSWLSTTTKHSLESRFRQQVAGETALSQTHKSQQGYGQHRPEQHLPTLHETPWYITYIYQLHIAFGMTSQLRGKEWWFVSTFVVVVVVLDPSPWHLTYTWTSKSQGHALAYSQRAGGRMPCQFFSELGTGTVQCWPRCGCGSLLSNCSSQINGSSHHACMSSSDCLILRI